MKKRHLLLWYRPGEGKPLEMQLSRTLLRSIVAAVVVLLLLIIAGAVFYTGLVDRAIERDQLLEENQKLRFEVSRVEQLSQQLGNLRHFSEQIQRSLTEGADLERILEAGEAVEREFPIQNGDRPWVNVSYDDSTGNGEDIIDMIPKNGEFDEVFLPERWPVSGFITRGFEQSLIDPALTHAGIDLAVPRGTPVRTVADGVVIAADWTPRYGHRIIIDHGGTVLSVYGHNELLLVQRGDRIKSGAPIALSGNSGVSTAPHLHLEIWVDGKVVDPRMVLPKRGDDHVVEQAG